MSKYGHYKVEKDDKNNNLFLTHNENETETNNNASAER
jgi:hypothetical protein